MKNTRFTLENNEEVAFLFKIRKIVLELHDKLIEVDNDSVFTFCQKEGHSHIFLLLPSLLNCLSAKDINNLT